MKAPLDMPHTKTASGSAIPVAARRSIMATRKPVSSTSARRASRAPVRPSFQDRCSPLGKTVAKPALAPRRARSVSPTMPGAWPPPPCRAITSGRGWPGVALTSSVRSWPSTVSDNWVRPSAAWRRRARGPRPARQARPGVGWGVWSDPELSFMVRSRGGSRPQCEGQM